MTTLIYRLLAFVAILAGLYFGYLGWRDHQQSIGEQRATERYNAAIDAQKMQARADLNTAISERNANALELAKLRNTMEVNREQLQAKNAADLRARRNDTRLQFVTENAGCRSGGDRPASDPPSAADNTAPTVVQLPEPLNGDLLDFAADAQSLAIDYGVLYAYVHNPKLVCELQR